MRKYKKHIALGIVGVLTLLFWSLGAIYAEKLGDFENQVTIFNQDAGMSSKEALALQEKNEKSDQPMSFTIWGQRGTVGVENKGLGRTTQVEALEVCGSTDLLFLDGPSIQLGDEKGCLVDVKVAMALFGGKDIIGLPVQYNQKEFVIRGILEGERGIAVFQATPIKEETGILNTVTAKKKTSESATILKEKLASQQGISGEVLEFSILNEISKMLVLIMPLLLGIALLRLIWRYIQGTKGKPKEKAIWISIFIIITGIFSWLFFREIHLSQEMVPTKWSDFDFWTKLWLAKKEAFMLLLKIPKRAPELSYVMPFLASVIYSLLALFGYTFVWAILKNWKTGSRKIKEKRL